MKAIGIVIRALNKGGAEKQSLLLAKALKEEYDIYYFVQKKEPRSESFVEFIEREKINCVFLTGNVLQRSRQLNKFIVNKNIGLVFSYLFTDNVLISMAKITNRNLLTIGGIRSNRIPKLKLVFNRFLHRFFLDGVIVNNYDGKKFLVNNGFHENKLHVIHNCILLKKQIEEKVNKDSSRINILSVGRFVYQKDYLTSLAVFKLLQQKVPEINFQYTIIGFGILESEIRNYIKDNDIRNVEIVLDPPNTESYYESADIYLNTSISEGLSNVLLEALNNKLPIVATDAGDNKYIIEDGVSGYLLKPKDVDSISKRLLYLSKNEDERKMVGEKGYDFLKRNFSLDSFKKKYINYIKEVANNVRN